MEAGMLIDDYHMELTTPDCDLSSSVYSAKVVLPVDISEALPYINAEVARGEYLPGVPVLVYKEGGRKYSLRPTELAVSNLLDRGEAGQVVGSLVRKINSIWERRGEIEPRYDSYEKPRVLDIYKLLPRSNCKDCGVPTCMAFAAKLSEGKAALEECPPLAAEGSSERATALRDMGL
jgi:ArsR family metal-binding transcriptional regulator